MNGSINGVVSPSTMTMEIVEGYQYLFSRSYPSSVLKNTPDNYAI